MKKSLPNTKTFAWIIAALFIAFLVAQPLPYYSYGEGETASILGYLAMPSNYPELTTHLDEALPGYTVNDIVGACILPQIGAIILLILVMKFKDNVIVSGATALWGIGGFIAYCTNVALKLGGGARTLFLILFAATAILAIASIVIRSIATKNAAGEEPAGEVPDAREAMAH